MSKITNRIEALDPDVSVLSKVASICVHVEESFSDSGHAFDLLALKQLLNDPDVREWLAAMDRLALIPKKR